jgi:hypothetical protein
MWASTTSPGGSRDLPATGIGYIRRPRDVSGVLHAPVDKAAFGEAFLSNVRRVALVSLPVGLGVLLAAHQIALGIFGDR